MKIKFIISIMLIIVFISWILPRYSEVNSVIIFLFSIILLPGLLISFIFFKAWEVVHLGKADIFILVFSALFYTVVIMVINKIIRRKGK